MENVNEEDNGIEKGRLLAFLSYLGILAILPFIIQPDNKFAVAHGRQGLCIFSWFVAASFFSIMPIFGPLVWIISSVLCLIFMIMGFLNALAGRTWVVPVFGRFFE